MSFIKKSLLVTGIPARPTTKKNRYAKRSMKELQAQTRLMRATQYEVTAQDEATAQETTEPWPRWRRVCALIAIGSFAVAIVAAAL